MASNFVFADTSFFKAYIDQQDIFHPQALKILQKLKKTGVILITSNYILDEIFTLLRVKCGLDLAMDFKAVLEEFETDLKIVRVLAKDEASAWEWFVKDWSKLSFTDCVSFALMERLSLQVAAAFDEHFKKAGFKVLN